MYLAQCDSCKTQEHMEWNGDHWLPKAGWLDLIEAKGLFNKGLLCPTCNPLKALRQKTKRTRKDNNAP